MKPKYLRIKGIKNYLSEQVIDFESLSSEGVFGICGNSGSGKSAIIDSLIIALYGDLPDNSNYNNYDIVNLTDKCAEIDFIFTLNVSNENKIYQITRKLQPLKSNKMSAEIFDITEKKISLASGQREVNNYVTNLLKLDVNDFAKCVVLVQGEYDKFISQKDSERKKMIGNIFSLKKYGEDLNNKVLVYRRELETNQNVLESLQESIGHIDQKTVDNKTKELKAQKDEQKKIIDQKHILEKSYSELEKGYKDYQDYIKLTFEIENANKEILSQKQNVENLTAHYKTAAEESKKQKELTSKKEQLKSYIDALNKNIGSQKRIDDSIEKRNKKAEEYKKLEVERKQNTQGLTQADDEIQNIQDQIKKQLDILYMSAGITCKFDDNLSITITEEFNAFSLKTDKYLDYNNQLIEIKDNIFEKDNQLNALIPIQIEAVKNKEKGESELNTLKEQEKHISMHNAATLIKSQVCIGEHCPVCDNIIKKMEKGNEDIENIDDIKKQIAFLEKGLFDITGTIALNTEKISNTEKELKEGKNKKDKLQADLNNLNMSLDCQKVKETFNSIKDSCLTLNDKLNKTKKTKQDLTAKLDVIKVCLSKVEEEGKTLNEQINEFKNDLKEVLGEYDSIDNALKHSKANYQTLEKQINDIVEAERQAEKDLNFAKSNLEKTEIKLSGYMREIGKLNPKEVKEQELQSAREILNAQNQKERDLSQKIGGMIGEIERLKNDLVKYNANKKELLTVKKRLDLVKELHKLTQGNKLMEFIAQEYIVEFTYTASEYLNMLTMGQFELEYDNGFFIKDYLNSGQYRNVNTVSGGEKFLVSLSLAIAISRALSRRAGAAAVEFLFIDEGFGTLDSGLIDTVMDTLDKLKGDFIIGLISHRQELQQRLPKKLIITKQDNDLTILQS